MIFKIDGSGGTKATDKAKAKSKASTTGGPSFASLLEEAQQAAETDSAPVAGGGIGVAGGFVPLEEDLPRDAQGQARELLKTLKELAGDALSGSPTATTGKLEALANAAAENESGLTDAQKRALDDVRTRAAVEAAKLKN